MVFSPWLQYFYGPLANSGREGYFASFLSWFFDWGPQWFVFSIFSHLLCHFWKFFLKKLSIKLLLTFNLSFLWLILLYLFWQWLVTQFFRFYSWFCWLVCCRLYWIQLNCFLITVIVILFWDYSHYQTFIFSLSHHNDLNLV